MPWYDQSKYDVRFEWGLAGAKRLSADADVTVVVDVLSFSTCVDIATSRGAMVFPFLYKDERAKDYAKDVSAQCADIQRSKERICLSPRTMNLLRSGERVVLPSPNGSAIAFSIESPNILCGCIRNAAAVAMKASSLGRRVLVIAAGEQWKDGSLRPSLDDMIGAGAILSRLPGTQSPEAQWAVYTFGNFSKSLHRTLLDCSTGQELVERGFPEDIEDAAELDVSDATPVLRHRCFQNEK